MWTGATSSAAPVHQPARGHPARIGGRDQFRTGTRGVGARTGHIGEAGEAVVLPRSPLWLAPVTAAVRRRIVRVATRD